MTRLIAVLLAACAILAGFYALATSPHHLAHLDIDQEEDE